jgi:transcriptional regulator with XRE-family HTH domain
VREQKRLTVVDLADRCGISPTRVAKLEAGLTDPRFDVLVALSDGLGVGLSALIHDDEAGQASLRGPGTVKAAG